MDEKTVSINLTAEEVEIITQALDVYPTTHRELKEPELKHARQLWNRFRKVMTDGDDAGLPNETVAQVKRSKEVLGTLIAWLPMELLGANNAKTLHNMLEGEG